jgi:hypothetical protein
MPLMWWIFVRVQTAAGKQQQWMQWHPSVPTIARASAAEHRGQIDV